MFGKCNCPIDLTPGLNFHRNSGLYSVHPYPSPTGIPQVAIPLADGKIVMSTAMVPWGTVPAETANTFGQVWFPGLEKLRV